MPVPEGASGTLVTSLLSSRSKLSALLRAERREGLLEHRLQHRGALGAQALTLNRQAVTHGAIPGAGLRLHQRTGHLPQIETPDALPDLLSSFAAATTAQIGRSA